MDQNLQAFTQAYATARNCAAQDDASRCNQLLLACLQLLSVIYQNSRTIAERAKTKGLIDQITHITNVLVSAGVTNEVRTFFKLPIKVSGLSAQRPVTPATAGGSGASVNPAPAGGGSGASVAPISPVAPATDKEWSEVVFDNSIKGVVTIHVPGGSGTGFIISDKGYLLTNHHVVSQDKYRGTFHNDITMNFDGSRRLYDLEFIDADPTYDVALCRFDPKSLPTFAVLPLIPDYSKLKKGAAVVLIGNPVSQGIAPFTGTVSYTCNNSGDLVYSSPSNPGCSGGPVLDKNGYVVGINKSLTVSVNGVKTQGFTNATPANQIAKLLKAWKDKHSLNF